MPSPPAIRITEFIIYPAPTKLSFKQSEIGKNSMRPLFYILKHILKPTDRPPAFAVPISFFLPPFPSARRFPLGTKTVNLFFDIKKSDSSLLFDIQTVLPRRALIAKKPWYYRTFSGIKSFPFDGCRGLIGNVVDHAVDTVHFVGYAPGDF